MRETRADTRRALIYAVALHVLIFLLMFAGLWWTRTSAPVSAAGPVVEAELIDPNALSARVKRVLAQRPEPVPPDTPPPPAAEEETAPPPQPQPEPRPQDAPVPQQQQAQEQLPEPERREQEQVDREAIALEQREKEQEEKRRQEQIDLTERQRQEEAEQKQRLAQQQKEEELKKIRAEMAKAKREADLAEQRIKQLADRRAQQASVDEAAPSASPPPGNQGVDTHLLAQYQAAIQEAVERNWNRPENIPPGQPCRLTIIQLPGGEVMSAQVESSCPYDEQGRRSVEAAVLKAQPLPYAGFETVFRRQLNFTFRPPN